MLNVQIRNVPWPEFIVWPKDMKEKKTRAGISIFLLIIKYIGLIVFIAGIFNPPKLHIKKAGIKKSRPNRPAFSVTRHVTRVTSFTAK
jgi:hypothetical protein